MTLSKHQREILSYIRFFQLNKGDTPTICEVAHAMKLDMSYVAWCVEKIESSLKQ